MPKEKHMTQQQIKRQNRKKLANLALIGLMAVLLVLGIFATIGSKGFASAADSLPTGWSRHTSLTVNYYDNPEQEEGPYTTHPITYTNTLLYSSDTTIDYKKLSIYVQECDGKIIGVYTYTFNNQETMDGTPSSGQGFLLKKDNSNYFNCYLSADKKSVNILDAKNDIKFVSTFSGFVPLPETPTAPEGKQFAGWYYDTAFTQPYQEGDVITSDTSLYAKFVDKVYTVTYVLNGASYSSAQVVHGAKTENVAISVATGKEFSGWYTNAVCTQAYNFDTAVTADVTLYAKIQTIMCTVTFYVGSEVLTTLSVPYGSTLVAYAASASAEADVAQAILNVYSLGNFDTAATIEEDIEVTITLNEGLLKWNNFGLWFMNNWKWVTACAGLIIVIIVGAVLTKKRR